MSAGYTFLGSALGEEFGQLATVALVACGVCVGAKFAASNSQTVPDDKFSVRNIFELAVEMIFSIGDMVMGKENRKHLPFVFTAFTFILGMNLLGLVPGFAPPTDQLFLNAGMAVLVFVYYNYHGIKAVGFFNYVKHFFGPLESLPIWLAPIIALLMFPIEILSHAFRPLTLSLRLFGNMTGDHAVVGAFNNLTAGTPLFFAPVAFYLLGTLVCFIQAFVFSLLTMIYIRLAVVHEHGHDEDHSHGENHNEVAKAAH